VLPQIILTEGRGTISVDERNNQLIITDVAEKIQKAKEIVKIIDKVTPQVIIEARIVEVSDSFSREFGTAWAIAGTKEDALGGMLGYDMAALNPPTKAGGSAGQIGIEFSRLIGDQFRVLDARLMASESEGAVKIISAPKILTLDNKPAKIKQGLAYPYNKLDADGNTTTEWKDIALELEVTPHITPDNRITMKITIKNNEIGEIINGETSFTTKEAYTELLVDDGDTIIIGGIRKTRNATGESGVPFLNQIPVLGWLFKTKQKTDEKQELLIFISPRIVQLEQVGPQG
jgi:type IV pilus assembly protein PilQ